MRPALSLVFLIAGSAIAQQTPDPDFDVSIAKPAHRWRHPKVLFDEAHHNFHTTGGRYKPFATLMRNDGFRLTPNTVPFTEARLGPYRILVIANAIGDERMNTPAASRPAFTPEECKAVAEWIRRGGALLLIADHAPMGAANQILARELGVVMGEGWTFDPKNSLPESPSLLIFTRDNGLLGDHPITRGRNPKERLSTVVAFTGQSLKGPPDSANILRLSPTAFDRPESNRGDARPVAGPSQCLAFRLGKGRVVVAGEAAMFSAQLAGPNKRPMGMNRPGADDRQFALNAMRWLSRKLK